MIKSMTGFGRSKISVPGADIRVEIKTFNHKFLEISPKISEKLQDYEENLKRLIKKNIMRGKVYLWINLEKNTAGNSRFTVDEKKLRKYYNALANIRKKFGIEEKITLTHLLALPEVFVYQKENENPALMHRLLNNALNKALGDLLKMRKKEGRVLFNDLSGRVAAIKKSLAKIEKILPEEVEKFRKKLRTKVNAVACVNNMSEEKLDAETAQFAKNCDISEELIRLAAHLDNFMNIMKTKNEAGKTMDFIAQELHREINTVGAKSADFRISKEVIFIKGEVEKIREQVQNIE